MMHWFKQQARAFIAFNYNSTVCIFYSRTRHDGLYFYKTACSGGLWECFFCMMWSKTMSRDEQTWCLCMETSGQTYGHVPDRRRRWALGCGSGSACSKACGIRLLDGLRRLSRYSVLSAALLHNFSVVSSLSDPDQRDSIDNIVPAISKHHSRYKTVNNHTAIDPQSNVQFRNSAKVWLLKNLGTATVRADYCKIDTWSLLDWMLVSQGYAVVAICELLRHGNVSGVVSAARTWELAWSTRPTVSRRSRYPRGVASETRRRRVLENCKQKPTGRQLSQITGHKLIRRCSSWHKFRCSNLDRLSIAAARCV